LVAGRLRRYRVHVVGEPDVVRGPGTVTRLDLLFLAAQVAHSLPIAFPYRRRASGMRLARDRSGATAASRTILRPAAIAGAVARAPVRHLEQAPEHALAQPVRLVRIEVESPPCSLEHELDAAQGRMRVIAPCPRVTGEKLPHGRRRNSGCELRQESVLALAVDLSLI